jgi:hypothetical protein
VFLLPTRSRTAPNWSYSMASDSSTRNIASVSARSISSPSSRSLRATFSNAAQIAKAPNNPPTESASG